jgi:hypothetical protein
MGRSHRNEQQFPSCGEKRSMPHKPYWWRELPRIRRELAALAGPVLSRREVERIFHVSTTEAHRLMKRMGCMRLGNALAVPTPQASRWLDRLESRPDAIEETDRRARLEAALAQAREDLKLREVAVPLRISPNLEGLPGTIQIAPPELRIQFQSFEDLLVQLGELIRAVAEDREKIEALCDSDTLAVRDNL